MAKQNDDNDGLIEIVIAIAIAISPFAYFAYTSNKIKRFLMYELKSLSYNTFYLISFIMFILIIISFGFKKLHNFFGMKNIGTTSSARSKQKKSGYSSFKGNWS